MAIPRGMGLDPTLTDIFENNRQAEAEELEDIRGSMRDMRGDMAELRGQAIRLERMTSEAMRASQETLGYCRAIADRFLEQFQHASGGPLPPMREKVPTLRDMVEAIEEATGPHHVEEIKRTVESLSLKADGETWRDIKKAARAGIWDAVRKGVGILLILAAGWAIGHLEGRATAPPSAPGAK